MKKKPLQVEIYFEPRSEQLPALRKELRNAMTRIGELPNWKEYYPGCELPDYLKKTVPPAIAINDHIIWSGKTEVPNAAVLSAQMKLNRSRSRFSWKRMIKNHLSFLMAVCIAFFPKCPFCWAAYMSLLAAWGIKTIPYQPWLLPVFCVLLVLNIASLYMTRRRHHYGPLILSLSGAFLVISNRYWFETQAIMYLGVSFLIIGSLWNSLSKRMASSVRHYLFGWVKT